MAVAHAEKLAQTLETIVPRAEHVIRQTVVSVLQNERVPAQENTLGRFEQHITDIRRDY